MPAPDTQEPRSIESLTSRFSTEPVNAPTILKTFGETLVSNPLEIPVGRAGLEGRTAFVTGGTSGLGRASAELLAANGVRVAIVGRNKERAEETVAAIKEAGGDAFYIIGDMTNPEEAEFAVRYAAQQLGSIDIGVLNAAVVDDAPILEMTEGQWTDVVHGNLDMTFYTLQALARHMERWGPEWEYLKAEDEGKEPRPKNIVYVSSIIAKLNNKKQANYAVMKTGGERLVEIAHQELDGVSFGVFRPGAIETPMVDNLPGRGPKAVRTVANMVLPQGRMFTPEEAARGVAFLAAKPEGGHVLTLT